MVIKLLLVAEVDLPDDTPDPEAAALLRVETLGESTDGITFWQPAIGATFERAGSRSVEVFY